ncbi:hypothetical protein LC612_43830, partial [Nostoc sp. CHAB 5834]|nr:hypothetical protein [Nostoc sp. CHAB 5834]
RHHHDDTNRNSCLTFSSSHCRCGQLRYDYYIITFLLSFALLQYVIVQGTDTSPYGKKKRTN